eukprot:Trichotokara_eunicae@DN6139_c0_g1_i1.p1
MIYLCGRGDGFIRFYHCEGSDLQFVTDYRTPTPAKQTAFISKRGVNVLKCEVARALKAEGGNALQPVSIIVPRKSGDFQEDLFPDCASGVPGLSKDEWWGGKDGTIPTASMKPVEDSLTTPFTSRALVHPTLVSGSSLLLGSRGSVPPGHSDSMAPPASAPPGSVGGGGDPNTKKEIELLLKRIKELEEENRNLQNENKKMLAAEKASGPSPKSPISPSPSKIIDDPAVKKQLEQSQKNLKELEMEVVALRARNKELDELFKSCQEAMIYAAAAKQGMADQLDQLQ